jgi:hypothetical protein
MYGLTLICSTAAPNRAGALAATRCATRSSDAHPFRAALQNAS